MGAYTKNLFRKDRLRNSAVPRGNISSCVVVEQDEPVERLVSVAIIRNGITHTAFKTHAELRRALKDEDPYVSKRGDVEGFMTSTGRFVDRRTANRIGFEAGQCQLMDRQFLSSDVDKW